MASPQIEDGHAHMNPDEIITEILRLYRQLADASDEYKWQDDYELLVDLLYRLPTKDNTNVED